MLQRPKEKLTVHVKNGSKAACIVKSAEISEWIEESVGVDNVGNSLIVFLLESVECIA